MSTERIIVQRSIADSFRKVLIDTTEKTFGTSAPPPFLVTPEAVKKNKNLISDAVFKGASVLFGDPNNHEPMSTNMRPLIVENVTKEMDLHKTESFGPTVSLYVVDREEEAIALANDAEYGLSAAVYTEELRRGLRVARQIESG
jgi:acyl-CoA reductase-like NAD-dependent aldehyde dehydrogenase